MIWINDNITLPSNPCKLIKANDTNITLEFKQVYSDAERKHRGVVHTQIATICNLNFIQFFWERGPKSHHIYQPEVNNRKIDWGSLKDSGEDRPLVEVLANRGNQIIDAPFAFFPYSLQVTPEQLDETREYTKVKALGQVLCGDHRVHCQPSLDKTYTDDIIFEEFKNLTHFFNLKVVESEWQANKLRCLFAFFFQLSDKAKTIHTKAGLETFIRSCQLHERFELAEGWENTFTEEQVPNVIKSLGNRI